MRVLFLMLFSLTAHAQFADIGTATLTVATSTTAEALTASNTFTRYLVIQADSGNTNGVQVGNSSTQYLNLVPGASVTLESEKLLMNLNKIYIQADTAGNSVRALYLEKSRTP